MNTTDSLRTVVTNWARTVIYTSEKTGHAGHKEATAWCKKHKISPRVVWFDFEQPPC